MAQHEIACGSCGTTLRVADRSTQTMVAVMRQFFVDHSGCSTTITLAGDEVVAADRR